MGSTTQPLPPRCCSHKTGGGSILCAFVAVTALAEEEGRKARRSIDRSGGQEEEAQQQLQRVQQRQQPEAARPASRAARAKRRSAPEVKMTEGEADQWVFDTLMGPLAEYDERQKPVRAVALAKYEKTFLREDPLTADVRCRTAQRSGHAIFNDMQWVVSRLTHHSICVISQTLLLLGPQYAEARSEYKL